MKNSPLMKDLIHFLENSFSPWHAVAQIVDILKKHHFKVIEEGDTWNLTPGKKYVVIRNGSLCAFILPEEEPKKIRLVGAHTDSPGFKLKPQAEFVKENMLMLGVEMYGSPLISSWLNRDLGIAGRVVGKDKNAELKIDLVNLNAFPVVLPQLAIHLDREVNEKGVLLNKQDQLAVLAALCHHDKENPLKYLKNRLKEKTDFHDILSHELFLYPLEKPNWIGPEEQLLASYRIDNLASVHAAMTGFVQTETSDSPTLRMVCFWNHEEIGSHTDQGAGSPFFSQTLERICLSLNFNREHYFKLLHNGLCVSIDMTHALHPNYPEKTEPRHPVFLDKGIAIKANAQHRYATDAFSAAKVIQLCQEHEIPFQYFVARGDIPAGTTIGPIHSTLTGMATVDIGSPQLSMHSCRELMASADHLAMYKFCKAFLSI